MRGNSCAHVYIRWWEEEKEGKGDELWRSIASGVDERGGEGWGKIKATIVLVREGCVQFSPSYPPLVTCTHGILANCAQAHQLYCTEVSPLSTPRYTAVKRARRVYISLDKSIYLRPIHFTFHSHTIWYI